jgi:hypothetical protein
MKTRALLMAVLIGTVLQVGMVVLGHSQPSVRGLFAVGGMGFSLVAGAAYGLMTRGAPMASQVLNAAVAGAICAFVGILVSYLLGDVPATLLALGTVSSFVTGGLGGGLSRLVSR